LAGGDVIGGPGRKILVSAWYDEPTESNPYRFVCEPFTFMPARRVGPRMLIRAALIASTRPAERLRLIQAEALDERGALPNELDKIEISFGAIPLTVDDEGRIVPVEPRADASGGAVS
jgi:hypothetical protein